MTDQELIQALQNLEAVAYGYNINGDVLGLDCTAFEQLMVDAADRLTNQNTHIAALQKAIEDLRAQLPRWIPVEERLPELQSWGASEVVLGLIKSENAPSLNKLHNLTLCVYCDNGIWSMPGRYVAITHWMPLPEPPEEKKP